jgi:hypothetical protein
MTKVLVCEKCRAVNEFYEGEVKSKSRNMPQGGGALIPLGSVGDIQGVKYVVTGCAFKKERYAEYTWHEYTLFSANTGLAFLTVHDGHWIFSFELDPAPDVKNADLMLDGLVYEKFTSYNFRIEGADGEFPYTFRHLSKVRVAEFIHPPFLLSCEKWGEDLKWFKGEYLQPSDISKAFSFEAPKREGVGYIQPYHSKIRKKPLMILSAFIAAIWMVLQVYYLQDAKEEFVFSDTYDITDSTNAKDIYTKSFDLKYGSKNVQLNMVGNVENSWAYAAVTLVNERTGDVYDMDMEVEYYSGYEDGESWQEGSSEQSKIISSIPEGRYHLVIHPEKPEMRTLRLTISVVRDVYFKSNGVLLLLLLAAYPVFYLVRAYQFDVERWSKSDYTPYNYE